MPHSTRTFATLLLVAAACSMGCEPALLTPIDGENNTTANNSTTNNSTSNNATANNGGMTNPFAGDMAAAVDGESLYTATACQSCHGAQGEGTASFPALDMTASMSDQELFDVIYDGRSGTAMSSFGEDNGGPLDDEETWKIVTFIRTLE